MKTKVVLYLRVSTDRQFMERQEKELTEYAHFKNWDIVTIIYEEISGRKTNRDGVRELLELAKEKKIDKILTHEVSRFGRNQADVLGNIEILKNYKVSLYVYALKQETLNDTGEYSLGGKFVISLFAALAEQESEMLSMRIKSGLKNAIAKGIKLGKPAQEKLKHQDKIHEIFKNGFFVDKNGDRIKATNRSVAEYLSIAYLTVVRGKKKLPL